MKRARIITSILLVASMCLTGCNGNSDDELSTLSKKDLIAQYRQLESQYYDQVGQYETLQKMYQSDQNTELPTSEISVMGDGTGRITLNSLDSSIIFPSSFAYPGTEPMAATGKINIVDGIDVTPGSNWTTKLSGSKLEMQHSGGISGTILVGRVGQTYGVDELQYNVIAPWFQDLAVEPSYKNIFVSNQAYGVQASTSTMIDSESAYLRCGMVAYSGYSLIYIFVYRGPQDVVRDESVMSVINSINISGSKVTVDP